MLMLWALVGCGWWEHRQACEGAQAAEEAAWTALEGALDADAAAVDPAPSFVAAQALDAAIVAEIDAKPAAVDPAEASQDAFTRASRAYGTDQGLAQAKWTDWSLRTQGHAAEADREVSLVAHSIERLDKWALAVADSRLRLALVRTRYDAALRIGEARLGVALLFRTQGDLAPLPEKAPPELRLLHDAALAAGADHEFRQAGQKSALDEAERLTFNVEHSGQTASGDATNYPYLNFPPEAQVAQAAAVAAGAAGTRATEAAIRLRAAVLAHKSGLDAEPRIPAATTAALDTATARVQAAREACR